jgi:hypothetical protein
MPPLPYFKFHTSAWINGNITLEEYETQGFFVNLCAFYWTRQGDCPIELIKKKYRNDHHLLRTLCEANIVKLTKTKLVIEFLDTQLLERETKAKQSRVNGKRGGRPRKTGQVSDGNLKKPNIDKRRKDKTREEYTEEFIEFWKLYPKREGKRNAFTQYQAAIKRGATHEDIASGTKTSPRLKREMQYVPYASTWLSGDGWEDEPEKKPWEGVDFAKL